MERAVGADAFDGGAEGSPGVAPVVQAAAAVEAGGVVGVERGALALAEAVVVVAEAADDVRKERGAVHVVPAELAERHGVGRVAHEGCLVHVEADARHGGGDGCAGEVVFDEHAAEFAVAGVDVVRPFHRDAAGQRVDGLGHSQGAGLRQAELRRSGNRRRVRHDREEQVPARRGLPMRSPLSPPGGLVVGRDERELAPRAAVVVSGAEQGGVGLFEQDGVEPPRRVSEVEHRFRGVSWAFSSPPRRASGG